MSNAEPKKLRVLILCTGNSARSQMAEGLLWHAGGGKVEAFSAGTKPGFVRPEAIQVMREIGLDITAQRSKSVEEFLGQEFDYVITVCDNANESSQFFRGKLSTFIRALKTRRPPTLAPMNIGCIFSGRCVMICTNGCRNS